MAGGATNSPGLVVVTTNVSPWPASSAGPRETFVAHPATVCGPAPAVTVWLAPGVNNGASLTGGTVTANSRVTVSPRVADRDGDGGGPGGVGDRGEGQRSRPSSGWCSRPSGSGSAPGCSTRRSRSGSATRSARRRSRSGPRSGRRRPPESSGRRAAAGVGGSFTGATVTAKVRRRGQLPVADRDGDGPVPYLSATGAKVVRSSSGRCTRRSGPGAPGCPNWP